MNCGCVTPHVCTIIYSLHAECMCADSEVRILGSKLSDHSRALSKLFVLTSGFSVTQYQ